MGRDVLYLRDRTFRDAYISVHGLSGRYANLVTHPLRAVLVW